MKTWLLSIFAMLVLAAPSVCAYAGPPYQTDDPAPVDYRNYEMYLGTQVFNGPGGVDESLPFFEFNYGPLPNVQFSFIVPYTYTNTGPFTRGTWSTGGIQTGLKFRFIQETKTSPQVAIFPQITIPTSSGGLPQLLLPIWAQKTIDNSTIFGGGGWERNPGFGNLNFWSGGIADTYQFSKVMNAGVELFGNTAERVGERGSTMIDFGMNNDFSDIHSLVASIGTSFAGQRQFYLYAAYEWRLGPRAAATPPAVSPR
jgi:hypothetical protein